MYKKTVCLVFLLLLLFAGTAAAIQVVPMAYQYFRSGFVFMSENYDGTLYLYGQTMAKQEVSRIEVTITLQQYKNGQWVNIASDSAVRFGASIVDIDRTARNVPRGYYYRLRGEHSVTHAGITETDISYTGAMYLD